MQTKTLFKLEYNKILDILSEFSETQTGKKHCKELTPYDNKEKIQKAQKETTDACILIDRKTSPSFYNINKIEEYILQIKNEKFLSIEGIYSIGQLLKNSEKLKNYFFEEEPIIEESSLKRYFDNLYTNPKIQTIITKSFSDEHTIDDHASPELYSIRKEITKSNQEIKAKLNSLLNSKYLQEPIITMRSDRYVVPVKSEYKSEVKGLIHDISSSGSTVFIEPLSVFEINNKINELKKEEQIEIEKILQKISAMLFEISESIENNNNLISILDFIFAKAKYSKSIKGIEPTIENDKKINLLKATHPLLPIEKAVPITINLGINFNTLLITGPNTGGKTVTLKTVGLLCSMGMSGLHIPASENSSICVFDNIFTDIGDEQSIAENLSTFSSHMTNIIEILNNATENSLILVDELGSGTDPIEGANLAISILENLRKRKILTIVTTHYPELKKYALITEEVENASCEFDIDTLSPTYRLLIGVPGQSNAFAISKKLGLSSEILDYAQSLVNKEDINIENLLKSIYDDKTLIETEKEIIIEKSENIKKLEKDLLEKQSNIDNKKKEIIEKAKLEARELLLDTKQEINELISEINKTNDSKIHNQIRNKLNKKISETSKQDETINLESIDKDKIEIGLNVLVKPLNQIGTILTLPNKSNKVTIQIGNMKTNFEISALSPIKEQKKEIPIKRNSTFEPKQIPTEINLIGYNIEESLPIVDKFLDNAALSKLEIVRIVHGKGTGTLGKGIQNFLKKHPHVKSYRYGTFGEGEMGVTIVELKK
ncbi:MAG: endonuclease MutS2 [Clostridia bacterium]|nr:endonuclease MutS2 [Clostridia bacterium]